MGGKIGRRLKSVRLVARRYCRMMHMKQVHLAAGTCMIFVVSCAEEYRAAGMTWMNLRSDAKKLEPYSASMPRQQRAYHAFFIVPCQSI